MSETTQTTIEEYETVNDPLADVEEGDEVRVEYESVYGGESTAEGEVVDVEDVYPLSNSGELVVITVADPSADCMFDDSGTRRVEYMAGEPYAVEGRNGGRWNRISELASETTVEVATTSTDGGEDVEEESNAHAARIAAQLAMADDEDEVDRGDGAATDGSGFVGDSDDASFCSECQRYRIECRHTRSTASDGGVRTTNTSGGRSWDMAEYEERAEELYGETSLTEGEARVAALKELGLSHSEIADELGLAKSTVDENSRRIRRRIEASRRTLEELTPLDDDGVVDAETEHEVAESLGEDRFGFEYVRCTCGMTYPRSAGGCPLEPVELGDD